MGTTWVHDCLKNQRCTAVDGGTRLWVMEHDLPYTDDTFLTGERSDHNVMVIKSILKCFELVTDLKINFHKSSFMGFKLDHDNFLKKVIEQLKFIVGSVPLILWDYRLALTQKNPKMIYFWWEGGEKNNIMGELEEGL
ncbi:hypothetical protein Lal_00010857 [Lupinus albus]|nr:hypothetical protein Lal_00010857 [Lupinus albus]